MVQKIVSRVITIITIIAILFALLAIFTTLTTKEGKAPSLFGFSIFRVVSGSMEPDIPVGSLVLIKKIDADKLKEGDVISFYSRDAAIKDEINTHRIVQIYETDEGLKFVTKGDANELEDAYPVSEQDIVGKVEFNCGAMGGILNLLSSKYGMVVFILVPLFVVFVINLKDVLALFRKAVHEEIEAAEKKNEFKDNNDK